MPDTPFAHIPVMVSTVTELMGSCPAGPVLDGTVGGAGHAFALLEAHPHLSVIGLDRDFDAVEVARARLARFADRATVVHRPFDEVADVLDDLGVASVAGALLDLGVSSPQLDRPDRGFSYRHDGPLDMRMDRTQSTTAADVVNRLGRDEIADLLRDNADERFARRIADAIVAARPLATTGELAAAVRSAIPAPARRKSRGDPARRTFQAVRIAVNDELGRLERALGVLIDRLAPAGRLAVVSYHSGEDRIVKKVMRNAATGGCTCPPRLPCVCGAQPTIRVLRPGAWKSLATDIERNPRSESARLRVAERRAEGASA